MSAVPLRLVSPAGEIVEDDAVESLREEVALKDRQNTVLLRRLTAAQNELDLALGVGENHDETVRLIALWLEIVMDNNKRVKTDKSSTRYRHTAKTVKRYSKRKRDEGMLEKAIRGVLLDDWAMGRIHKSGGRRFCDIEVHIFKDDYSIEKFAGLYERSLKEQQS